MRHRLILAFLGLMFAETSALAAQARLTGGDVEGTVSDQAGGVVPACTITVTNLETNVSRDVTTDAAGRYRVAALAPGSYTVTATLQGFRTQSREQIDLQLGQALTVDFVLSLETSANVTVTASAPLVSTSRTEVSSVVSQQQIDQLPVNGRNFIGFAAITPGIAVDRSPAQGVTATSGLSFTGQRGRSNNIMVDGFDNNDPTMGSVRVAYSQEAVREFQVLTDSYSAEFGKAAGGVVNIVTKSGTNTLHGKTFFYFRDTALNAKGHFDKYDIFGNRIALDKPPFSQKQLGGTLGGPVKKGETFFFLSFERTGLTDARTVTIDPAAAATLNAAGFPVELGNVPLKAMNWEAFGKVDHQWSSTRALTARANYARIDREGIDDFGGIVARSRGTVQRRHDWSLSAAETDVLSSRWINEARVQYAVEDQRVESLDPLCGGPCTAMNQGGPTLEIIGVASVGRQRSAPQLRHVRRLQLLETTSFFTGAHQFKVGAEYNHLSLPGDGNALPATFGGRYVFTAIPPAGIPTALDGLRNGRPAAYVQGYGNPFFPNESYSDLSLFVQDEWRRGRVVIKPGVRYQRQFWQNLDLSVSDIGGTTFSYSLPSDSNNIAPRLAVAYDLTGDSRTVLRGSYGMFFDNIVTSVEAVGRLVNGTSTGVRTLVLPFPLSMTAWNAPGHRLTETQALAVVGGSYPSLVVAPEPSLANGYTHQASAGVDRAIGSSTTVSVSGIYVRGFEMPGPLDYNPVLPATLGPGRRPNDLRCEANPAAACINGGIPGTSATVLQFTAFGESWYKGLTVAVNQRLRESSQLLLSYTLSKAEDTSADFQAAAVVQNSGRGRNPNDKSGLPLGFDPELERGASVSDQRHRFVLSGTYQFPGNVQLSGIVTAASGRPFSPMAGADVNGDGNAGAFLADRARRDPALESTSVGRNSETTAAQVNVDARVSKRIPLGQRASLDLMIEAFNLFNRTNFIEDVSPSSFAIFGTGAFPSNPLPTYGKYTLTLPPRQVQLATRISF